MTQELGISGRIARFFLENQLTPLLALTALLMGVFAVLVTCLLYTSPSPRD